MSEWVGVAPTFLIAVALATLPGLPAAWMLGFRGLTLVAASIAASFASVALASIGAPLVGMRWGILPVLAIAILLALVLMLVKLLVRQGKAVSVSTSHSVLWVCAAMAVAALLIGQELVRDIGSPENISQTYDGVFHLNAAAQILITGDASPFHLDLYSPSSSSSSFYPTVWHAFVALVAGSAGIDVPAATNITVLVVATWVWPVAILFFSRPFFVTRPAHLVLGGILAANFTAFPYLMLAWGVLYPNLLSTALIPLALGFIYPALRHRAIHSLAPLSSLWIAAAGALGAAVLTHPNALFGIALLTIPILAVVANDTRTLPIGRGARVARWTGIGIFGVVCVVLWIWVKTEDNNRSYGSSLIRSLAGGLTNAPMVGAPAWFLSVLVLTGIIILLLTRRHRWLILSYALVLGLFTVARGLNGSLRDVLTGAWYNDPHRIAALLPIATIPLAGIASAKLLDYVLSGLSGADTALVNSSIRRCLPAVGSVVLFALLITGARGQSIPTQGGWIKALHDPRGANTLLSLDERTLLDRLPSEVPKDAVIAGDPWTGAGLALAVSERHVLFPELSMTSNATALELGRSFSTLGAEACPLLERLGVTYLLDFGTQRYDNGEHQKYEPYIGLHDIGASPIVTEIDREGTAALFRVNCG